MLKYHQKTVFVGGGMERKHTDILYLNVFKGLMISFVVIGHAILLVLPNLSAISEKVFFMILAKFLIPSVFAFFSFFGYSQGTSRGKTSAKKFKKRFKNTFLTYILWASFAWIAFQLIGKGYDAICNTKGFTEGVFLPFNYLGTVFTFSISWQYYFIAVFLLAMIIMFMMRKIPVDHLKKWVQLFTVIQFVFYGVITAVLWGAAPESQTMQLLGIITYANPLSWLIPLFWGYYRGAVKKDIFGHFNKGFLIPLQIVFFILSVVEITILSDKWGAYCVMDHFTLLTLVNSILMMFLYKKIVERLLSMKAGWIKGGLDKMSTMGMYSIIPFYVHMPYQWFIFYFLNTTVLNVQNTILSFIIISVIGLLISYLAIIGIRRLPKKQKKLFLGI
jgi:hypothetical protein